MDQRLADKLGELKQLMHQNPLDSVRALIGLSVLPLYFCLQLLPWFLKILVLLVVLPYAYFTVLIAQGTIRPSRWEKKFAEAISACFRPWLARLRIHPNSWLISWITDSYIPILESTITSRSLQFRYIAIWTAALLCEGICGFSIATYLHGPNVEAVRLQTYPFVVVLVTGFLVIVGLLVARVHLGRSNRRREKSIAEKPPWLQEWHSLRCAVTSDAATFSSIILFYLAMVVTFVLWPSGAGDWVTDWLCDSGIDSSLIERFNPRAYEMASTTVKSIVAALLFFVPLTQVSRLAAILVSASRRAEKNPDVKGLYQAMVKSIGIKTRKLVIRPAKPWLRNAALTFWWLLFCYVALFLIHILWLDHWEVIYRMYGPDFPPGYWKVPTPQQSVPMIWTRSVIYFDLNSQLNVFVAAVFALFGTTPFAIMSSNFLPSGKPSELVISAEGLLFPTQFLWSLQFRPLRAWSDLKRIRLRKSKFSGNQIEISFLSGGCVRFLPSQLSTEQLDQLLAAIDEYSDCCAIDESVLEFRKTLPVPSKTQIFGDAHSIVTRNSSKYRSTIFTPLFHGQMTRNGTIRIIRQISSRPLSAVYLCRTESRLAILKQFVLPANSDESLTAKKAFERECSLLKSLDHPQIVRMLDIFDDGESSFLLLDHARGQDLFALIADQGPRDEKTILEWAEQLCQIMIYLHTQEPAVLHRDLTPDNIVLDETGQLRLIDFGAANQFMEGVTGTLIGKQAYIAPEQLRGKATCRSDIYSFGGTLYYLLTGKEPRALSQCDPLNEGYVVSKKLNELISICTDFEEQNRPDSFARVLEILSSSEPIVSEVLDGESIPLAIGVTEQSSDSVTVSLKKPAQEKIEQKA